jgi:hypothetical protein
LFSQFSLSVGYVRLLSLQSLFFLMIFACNVLVFGFVGLWLTAYIWLASSSLAGALWTLKNQWILFVMSRISEIYVCFLELRYYFDLVSFSPACLFCTHIPSPHSDMVLIFVYLSYGPDSN